MHLLTLRALKVALYFVAGFLCKCYLSPGTYVPGSDYFCALFRFLKLGYV